MSEKERKEIDGKIRSELQPFLDAVISKRANYELFKDAFFTYRDKARKSRKIMEALVPGKWLFAPKKKIDEKETAHLRFVYLGLVESFGNSIAEIISMLLIANGIEFHIERRRGVPRIKHVVSVDDFENNYISLGTKLAFLEDNKIKKLPSIINSRLRNDIAHFNFKIKKEGIYVRGQLAPPLIYENIVKLFQAIQTTNSLLKEWAKSKGLPKNEGNKP